MCVFNFILSGFPFSPTRAFPRTDRSNFSQAQCRRQKQRASKKDGREFHERKTKLMQVASEAMAELN